MKTLYRCDKCGRLFENKKECQEHEVSEITVAWLLVVHVDPGRGTASKRPMIWAYHSLSPELSRHKALDPWGDGMSFRILVYRKADVPEGTRLLQAFAEERLEAAKGEIRAIDPSRELYENDVYNE